MKTRALSVESVLTFMALAALTGGLVGYWHGRDAYVSTPEFEAGRLHGWRDCVRTGATRTHN